MKKLFYPLIALLGLGFITSCNDDSESLDPNVPIYQQYEVNFFERVSETNVFANFRTGGEKGERIELNNGAMIIMNGTKMNYFPSTIDAPGSYDYYLSSVNSEVINFNFIRKEGVSIANSVSRSDISPINIPTEGDIIKFKNEERIDVGFNPMKINEMLSASLIPYANGELDVTGIVHYGKVDNSGKIYFEYVPNGKYQLKVLNKKVIPTTNNDKDADGSITIYYVDMANAEVISL